ncbi:MAG TPA: metallophosphoesterase [Nocardioidaceae bacterium]|nr:metallophosphoesterase [Nocardioidaceae bacterium]
MVLRLAVALIALSFTAALAELGVTKAKAATAVLSRVEGPVVVAAGDIACPPGRPVTATACRQRDTARLAASFRPRRVLALGDLQYPASTLGQLRTVYKPSWGRLKPITRPVPGNHEYMTPRAAGYYGYFTGQRPPGYYAFDVRRWRIYALNSNCHAIDCDRELRWMRRDMVANPRACTLMMLHYPLYSSGPGARPIMRRFWRVAYRHGTDIALAGHDHHYERFRRMDAVGNVVDDGIQSFVVGTGGRSLHPLRGRRPGSLARSDRTFGVLAIRLGADGYAWTYRTTRGTVPDSGTATCR